MISVPLDPLKLFQMLLDKFYEDPTKQHNLWIDDVFVTGILAKRAGVRHRSHLKLPPTKKTKLGRKVSNCRRSIGSAFAFDWEAVRNASARRRRRIMFVHLAGRDNHKNRVVVEKAIRHFFLEANF